MNKEKADRFFIPIAEEYIKAGMLDEAIAVLKEGLQKYPNYLGARVSLGKVYLEKGMIDEAIKEFEHVVQLSPDNLFAHRKLASLYKELGRIDEAIKAYQMLLVFSPKDKEIAELLSNLMTEKTESFVQKEDATGLVNQTAVSNTGAEEIEKIDFTSTWEIESGNGDKQGKEGEDLVTETMGDLYISQGDIGKGAQIYRRILEREPDNESVREKLERSSGKSADSIKDVQINHLRDLLGRIQRNKR